MNTPTKRVFITVQGGVAYNDEEKSDAEVTVLILDFDNDPECAICEAQIKEDDEWTFSDEDNDFVHTVCALMESEKAQKEYLAGRGQLCPFCGSEKIEAGDSGFDGMTAEVEVDCRACGERWDDIYTLTGFSKR